MNLKEAEKAWGNWIEHPAQFVVDNFGVTPDPWQAKILEAFPHRQRQAMQACKGPGKTTLLAWLACNFLATRPHPKIPATSISGDNLADNLWPEMAKWMSRSDLMKSRFTWTKTRIYANDHPEDWFMAARAWPKSADPAQQADTLAGFHAEYILFILDEAGGIPKAVLATAEAALAACTEGHLVMAGNPTQLDGALYDACVRQRHLWDVTEITGDPDDPLRSPRVSIEWAKQQIASYGKDNPWVLVNIFGKFPPASINSLIGSDEVSTSMKRFWRAHEIGQAPKILGVDVARFGDDSSVRCRRQGIQMFPFEKRRNVDSTQGAGWIARDWNDWDADACFVDDTGGFGAGWIDQMRLMGKSPIGIAFSSGAHNASRYANKRAEMYFDLVAWIKAGGALPECPELLAALTQTTYTFQRDKLLLEPKDQIKVKLGYSPDEADAAALTFAEPVAARSLPMIGARSRFAAEYDPFRDVNREPEAYR